MITALKTLVAASIFATLAGCGGGGGSTPSTSGSLGTGIKDNGGVGVGGGGGDFSGIGSGVTSFQPSSKFAGQCDSETTQNQFLRSWTHELYLWYGEVDYPNPADYSTADYFDLLKTEAVTPSGRPKDQFHFTIDSATWEALSKSGEEFGYGAQWMITSSVAPRHVFIVYTEPDSPATQASANLTRGVEVMEADGVDVRNADDAASVMTVNEALFPSADGQTHTFSIREQNGTIRSIVMTSQTIVSEPVQNVRSIASPAGPVGYMLFNDHIATSEPALIEAIDTLKGMNVVDLVLDVRYNGGGYLDIASELAYMIAGSATTGRTFERLVFNDKNPTTDPVTGAPLVPTPFHTTTQIQTQGEPLPTLNLSRVYVLTSGDTCSASESIINGLRGIDVAVYQIGGTTCGKPYGFYPRDNCETTYFSIQFEGLNAKDHGGYSDGFSPNNTNGVHGELVPGCAVADDLTHQLGDPFEGMLKAALDFRDSNNQVCPTPPPSGSGRPNALNKPDRALSAVGGVVSKSPWRENRILLPRS